MSKITFSRRRQYGINMYWAKETDKYSVVQDTNNKQFYIRILEDGEWKYPYWNSVQDGFERLVDAQDWLSLHDWENADKYHIDVDKQYSDDKDREFEDAMDFLGFTRTLNNMYTENDPTVYELSVKSSDNKYIDVRVIKYDDGFVTTYWIDGKRLPKSSTPSDTLDVSKLVQNIEKMLNKYKYNMIVNSAVIDVRFRDTIMAAINTRNLADNMVRVKSSNVWSYGMNIKDRHDKTGDVLVQFKDNQGGPGDIYIYYDVEPRVYRKWQSAPSKGSYFWKNIRNRYKYSKLTGDKRGKLVNAIN